MQQYTFAFEVKDLLFQFLHAFDGAVIKRYNDARIAVDNVGVRYVYSAKQRVLHDLINKAQHITLPCVAFNISSISRDVSRVFNKLEGHYYTDESDSAKNRHILQPVPVNINIAISIMTRYQTDMDQILSNFVPYSDPYFVISWTRDGLPYREIRTEVLWNGSLNLSYPIDLNNNQPARVVCDTGFTIKGWLFKSDAQSVGRIFKIDSNFSAVSAIPSNASAITSIQQALQGFNSIETITVSARPQLQYIDKWLAKVGDSGTVSILGDMLEHTNAVYVSGASGMFTNTNILTAFEVTNLSAKYLSLSGLKPVTSYSIETNNKLTIVYEAPLVTGYFDIIVVNEAGYGRLTEDSVIHYSPIQLPYAQKGIQVN